MNLLYKIIQTASTMWLGTRLTAGYAAAPVLFRLPSKMQAGGIADTLPTITALCGLAISDIVYAFFRKQLASLSWWILAPWLPLTCNHFSVTSVIEARECGLDN